MLRGGVHVHVAEPPSVHGDEFSTYIPASFDPDFLPSRMIRTPAPSCKVRIESPTDAPPLVREQNKHPETLPLMPLMRWLWLWLAGDGLGRAAAGARIHRHGSLACVVPHHLPPEGALCPTRARGPHVRRYAPARQVTVPSSAPPPALRLPPPPRLHRVVVSGCEYVTLAGAQQLQPPSSCNYLVSPITAALTPAFVREPKPPSGE